MPGNIMLKIGDKGGYEDGDVLCAFTRRHVRQAHAEFICHPRRAGRTADGLRPDGLARQFRELTCQYRFRRIARRIVRRRNLWTNDVDEFGPDHINVPTFIRRRKANANHAIFGTRGAEVWYGGWRDFSNATLLQAWQEIEARTPFRDTQHRQWPAGRFDLQYHLMIPVRDFSEARANQLVRPLLHPTDLDADGNPVVVKRRKRRIPWRLIAGLTADDLADIPNRARRVEIRDRVAEIDESLDVQEKEVI
jgi:hypothetical protein